MQETEEEASVPSSEEEEEEATAPAGDRRREQRWLRGRPHSALLSERGAAAASLRPRLPLSLSLPQQRESAPLPPPASIAARPPFKEESPLERRPSPSSSFAAPP